MSINSHDDPASYNRATILSIIDSTPVLQVAFNPADAGDDPFPVILPMLGCTASCPGGQPSTDDTADPSVVYLHGYVSARLMKLPGSSEHSSRGLPITISASLLDGLVLSLTPFHNSCNYRSVVVFGYATVVEDEEEKLVAMKLITDNIAPGRWDNSRVPPTKTEMNSTSVLRVQIHSASSKLRSGPPIEDRKDLRDDPLRAKVWTGVVPAWIQWGEPVPAKENRAEKIPDYLTEWVHEMNTTGKETAVEAAQAD